MRNDRVLPFGMGIRYPSLPPAEESDALKKVQALRAIVDQCIRFLPKQRKIEVISRAKNLLRTLDTEKSYPYREIYESVMGFSCQDPYYFSIDSAMVRTFLICFIETASTTANLTMEDIGTEPAYDKDQAGATLNVSTKTIDRYRNRGLLPTTVIRVEGRQKIMFLLSDIDHFRKHHDPTTNDPT